MKKLIAYILVFVACACLYLAGDSEQLAVRPDGAGRR